MFHSHNTNENQKIKNELRQNLKYILTEDQFTLNNTKGDEALFVSLLRDYSLENDKNEKEKLKNTLIQATKILLEITLTSSHPNFRLFTDTALNDLHREGLLEDFLDRIERKDQEKLKEAHSTAT
jgi:hypothetical protein